MRTSLRHLMSPPHCKSTPYRFCPLPGASGSEHHKLKVLTSRPVDGSTVEQPGNQAAGCRYIIRPPLHRVADSLAANHSCAPQTCTCRNHLLCPSAPSGRTAMWKAAAKNGNRHQSRPVCDLGAVVVLAPRLSILSISQMRWDGAWDQS